MVNYCCVCSKSGSSGYYSIPNNPGIRAKWLEFAKISEAEIKPSTKICRLHFVLEDFHKPKFKKLKDHASPSKLLVGYIYT